MTRRGSQAVEFALVLPILLMMISAAVDVGDYLGRNRALVEAAADGARAGAADADDPAGVAEATAATAWDAMGSFGTPRFSASIDGQAPQQRVVVSATLPYEPFFGLVPTPETLSYTCAFRLDDQE